MIPLMLRPRPLLVLGAGALALAVVVIVGGPAEPPATVVGARRPPTSAAEPATTGEAVSRAVRNVTPPGVTPGPAVTGPLIRIAPPPAPPPPRPARSERVYHPIVVSAGVIKAGGRDIHLAGVVAPEFDTTCGQGSAAWPCGRMARAALRQFIRGRAVECAVPPGADEIPSPGTCSVGGKSLSEWLVAQGWARPAGAAYAALEDAARRARLGLWSGGRPGGQPEPLAADAVAGDSPTAGAPESSPASALAIKPRVSGTP
jgi:endonuclease YncB( thermonuclease family)